jgi:uncharacterized protein YdaL
MIPGLEKLAERLFNDQNKSCNLGEKQRRIDAVQLINQANKLLKETWKFYMKYSTEGIEEGTKERAREAAAQRLKMGEHEAEIFEAGLSPFSFQYAIFGLSYHMVELSKTSKRPGRKKNHRQRYAL